MEVLRHAHVHALRPVLGGCIRLRLVQLAIRKRERRPAREVRRLNVAGHINLVGRRNERVCWSGGAGARRDVDQEIAADLFSIREAQIAANVAVVDVHSFPELFEAVGEDDAQRRIGGADGGDCGEAAVLVISRHKPERIRIPRQHTRLVRPHHQARHHVLPLLVINLVQAGNDERRVFRQLELRSGARRPFRAVQPHAARHSIAQHERGDDFEICVRCQVRGSERRVRGVVQTLLRDAESDADVAAPRLHHRGVSGDFNEI